MKITTKTPKGTEVTVNLEFVEKTTFAHIGGVNIEQGTDQYEIKCEVELPFATFTDTQVFVKNGKLIIKARGQIDGCPAHTRLEIEGENEFKTFLIEKAAEAKRQEQRDREQMEQFNM